MLDELQLYLNFNASGKVEAHESFHSLLVGVENIDQSLVGPALELLTGILVLVNSAENGNDLFLGRQIISWFAMCFSSLICTYSVVSVISGYGRVPQYAKPCVSFCTMKKDRRCRPFITAAIYAVL